MLHACSIFWSYHPWHNWTKHRNINFIIFNVPMEWIKFWLYFGSVGVFPPTEPVHLTSTLSLWAVHTSSKGCRKIVIDSPISTSGSAEPVNPKSKLKTKTGLAEKGNIVIRDTVTRYAVIWVSITETGWYTRKVKDSSLTLGTLNKMKLMLYVVFNYIIGDKKIEHECSI